MSTSSRESAQTVPIVVRKRARTRVLLGAAYEEVVTQVLASPMPHKDPEMYTTERVKEGLLYADSTLRNTARTVSPIGVMALKIYKDACCRLLQLDDEQDLEHDDAHEAKQQWIATIRGFEESMQYNACLRATQSDSAESLKKAILELQRITYYARYGDFFAEVCRLLSRTANAKKVEGYRLLIGRYWTETAHKLQLEEPFFKKLMARDQSFYDKCPIHLAVISTCGSLGLSFDDTIAAIHLYGERNEIVHTNFLPLIRDGDYPGVALVLYKDFCQLRLVMPPELNSEAGLMLRLIECMIDTWFERDEDLLDKPKSWSASPVLRAHGKRLRGAKDTKTEVEVYKDISLHMIQALKNRMTEIEKAHHMTELLGDFKFASPAKRAKRVASEVLESERKRIATAEKDFRLLLDISWQAMEMKDAYLAKYPDYAEDGELLGPPEIEGVPSVPSAPGE